MPKIMKIRTARIDTIPSRGPSPRVTLEIELKPELLGVNVDLGPILDSSRYMGLSRYSPNFQQEAYQYAIDEAIQRLVRHFEDNLRESLREHAMLNKPVTIYDAFKG